MLNGLGTPQSTPQGGQALGGSDDTGTDPTELGELDGLLSADDDTDGAGLGDEPGSGDGDTGDEGDNPEGDNDEGQQADDDTPEGEQEPAAQFTDDTEVELEDGGRKVSVRELKESFSTFTRKTQELAETERTIERQAADAVSQHSEHLAQRFRLVHKIVADLVQPGMTPEAMRALAYSDPERYQAERAKADVVQQAQREIAEHVRALEQHAKQTREAQQQQAAETRQQLLADEATRLRERKWWNADFQAKAVVYAKKHGIPAHVAQLALVEGTEGSAGLVDITRKAMLYDEALAKTKNGKQPPKPAPTRPASTPGKGKVMQARQSKGLYEKARASGDRTDIGKYVLENL
jgi:hypothetical protein